MKIMFDLDGTIADLYGVDNWLNYILNEDATPYKIAKTIGDIETIVKLLKALQENGIEIGVITWLAKNANRNYDTKVRNAKYAWLKRNINLQFNEIHIVKYGTLKDNYRETENDILFDDEELNRNNWNGKAYPPEEIINVLTTLLTNN